MGNVRPFWRAIERERLGTGHSLAVRRHQLASRRLGIQTALRTERRREAQKANLAPVEKPGLFKTLIRKVGNFFNGKKSN